MPYSQEILDFFNRNAEQDWFAASAPSLRPFYSDSAGHRLGPEQAAAGHGYPFVAGDPAIAAKIGDISVEFSQDIFKKTLPENLYPVSVTEFCSDIGLPKIPGGDSHIFPSLGKTPSEMSLLDWANLPVGEMDIFKAKASGVLPEGPYIVLQGGNGTVLFDSRHGNPLNGNPQPGGKKATTYYRTSLVTDLGATISRDYKTHYWVQVWGDGCDVHRVIVFERISSNNFVVPGLVWRCVTPQYGMIDGSCVSIAPPSVIFRPKGTNHTPVTVSEPKPVENLRGSAVILSPGSNTVIKPDTWRQSGLEFSFGAGKGTGRAKRDTLPVKQEVYLQSINGVRCDSGGNLQVGAKACYSFSRVVDWDGIYGRYSYQPGKILMTSTCQACCQCADYVDTYEDERVLADLYTQITQNMIDLHSRYESSLQSFQEAVDFHPIKIITEPIDATNLAVGISISNTVKIRHNAGDIDLEGKGRCLRNVFLFMEFEYEGQESTEERTCEIVDGSVYRRNHMKAVDFVEPKVWRTVNHSPRYVIAGTYPNFWAYFEGINPGATAVLNFVLRWPEPEMPGNNILTLDAYSCPCFGTSDDETSPLSGVGRDFGEPPALSSKAAYLYHIMPIDEQGNRILIHAVLPTLQKAYYDK